MKYRVFLGSEMKTGNISARLDLEKKMMASKILESLGMTHSQYVNMAYTKLIQNQGIPYELTQADFNADTVAAMEDDDLTKYDSVDSFMEDI